MACSSALLCSACTRGASARGLVSACLRERSPWREPCSDPVPGRELVPTAATTPRLPAILAPLLGEEGGQDKTRRAAAAVGGEEEEGCLQRKQPERRQEQTPLRLSCPRGMQIRGHC